MAEKFNRQKLEHIQTIFQEKTGVNVTSHKNYMSNGARRIVAVAGVLCCFLAVSVIMSGQERTNSIKFDMEAKESFLYGIAVQNDSKENAYYAVLQFEDWTWPTMSEKVSAIYGTQKNGAMSDHINIAGNEGDEIYAVADGTVVQTGFDFTYGNYIMLDLGEGMTVKYGHIKESFVNEGDVVANGQNIATLGKTGMATGPNLSFTVYVYGEPVNPLEE